EPMADEHVGSEPDQLPENEQHHEVVREHDPEHGEHEKGQRCEVARLANVVPHVAERINVDEQPDSGHEHQHHFAQVVENEAERDGENSVNVDPSHLRRGDVRLEKNQTSANETSENSRDRNETAKFLRSSREQSDRAGRDQWQEQRAPRNWSVDREIHKNCPLNTPKDAKISEI